MTHVRRGLEFTTNTLKNKLDTSENESINTENKKLDAKKNTLIADGYQSLGDLDRANQKTNPDTLAIEPLVP
jgi:hypothetical protein